MVVELVETKREPGDDVGPAKTRTNEAVKWCPRPLVRRGDGRWGSAVLAVLGENCSRDALWPHGDTPALVRVRVAEEDREGRDRGDPDDPDDPDFTVSARSIFQLAGLA